MLACIFSIEIQTAGQIAMKFGLEVVLEGGMVLGFFTQTPPPGASGASVVLFVENFMK